MTARASRGWSREAVEAVKSAAQLSNAVAQLARLGVPLAMVLDIAQRTYDLEHEAVLADRRSGAACED